MSTYYIHDGRNEVGPFSIDLLKKQKLTRNTPIRQMGTDNWMPAEKLAPLKGVVTPGKIKRPQDIVPVIKDRVAYLKERRPKVLYGSLFLIALIAGVSLYTVTKTEAKALSPVVVPRPSEIVARYSTQSTPTVVVLKEEKKPPVVAEDKAKATRLRWNKLIHAANSNYGIGFLGGIKDLSVVITNRTDYPIDEAVAKITYIKSNGSIWKTKLITIYGVPAHDSKEQSVPDVGRGKKVKVSIQKIVSKKMKFSYTEGQKIKSPDDPYVIQ
ncbi:MAG TPA: DUF4339 domain-containing protein [Flavisolibacter sp.]|jgi:hypothetical protein